MSLNSQITVIQKNKTPSVLQYENRLLQQRNRMLSKENQELLNRVEEIQIQLKCTKEKYGQKLDNVIKKQKQQINRILNTTIPEIHEQVHTMRLQHLQGKVRVLQELNCEKSSPKTLVKCLVDIICELLKEKENIRSENRLSKFTQILNRRKSQHNQIKELKTQTLHFIKEPPTSGQSISKIMEPIHCFYRSLVRKVKRQSIKHEFLNQIFDEISDYVENKQKIKTKNLRMMKLEREWELGLGSQIDLSEHSEQLTQRTYEISGVRESLMHKIANIR